MAVAFDRRAGTRSSVTVHAESMAGPCMTAWDRRDAPDLRVYGYGGPPTPIVREPWQSPSLTADSKGVGWSPPFDEEE